MYNTGMWENKNLHVERSVHKYVNEKTTDRFVHCLITKMLGAMHGFTYFRFLVSFPNKYY